MWQQKQLPSFLLAMATRKNGFSKSILGLAVAQMCSLKAYYVACIYIYVYILLHIGLSFCDM